MIYAIIGLVYKLYKSWNMWMAQENTVKIQGAAYRRKRRVSAGAACVRLSIPLWEPDTDGIPLEKWQ